MVGKFRKKPLQVEAIRWTGDNWVEIFEFTNHQFEQRPNKEDKWDCVVFDKTHNCQIPVAVGEWVVKGISGEFYPCANQIFWETYDQIGAIL